MGGDLVYPVNKPLTERMKMEATKRPWHTATRTIHAENGELIATCTGRNEKIKMDHCSNAALIVRAVNSHDALVAALQDAQNQIEYLY